MSDENKGNTETQKETQDQQTQKAPEVPTSWEEVFKHPRFKELSEEATRAKKELDKIQKEKEQAEEARLKEQNEWKTLAEKREAELNEIKSQLIKKEQDFLITNTLREKGVSGVAVNDALVLINRDGLSDAQSIDKAVDELLKDRVYLLGKQSDVNLGAKNINQQGTEQKPVFKRSQLRDHSFYLAHQKEIDQAFKEGRIVAD